MSDSVVFLVLVVLTILYPSGFILCFLGGYRMGFRQGCDPSYRKAEEPSGWMSPADIKELYAKPHKAIVPGKVSTDELA